MSPAETAKCLAVIARKIQQHRQHIVAAELAIRGFRHDREEIPAQEQIEAISEVLQSIAQVMDEHASGIMAEGKNVEAGR